MSVHEFSHDRKRDAPSVKHMQAPRIQHHVTDAGPPRSKGVLNVVAILEHRPMILNAKLICRQKLSVQHVLSITLTAGGGCESRAQNITHRRKIGEFTLEGRHVADLLQDAVIVEGAVHGLVIHERILLRFVVKSMIHTSRSS